MSPNLGCQATSVEDVITASTALTIGPNPASEIIRIRSHRDLPMETAEIFDFNGRLINSYEIHAREATLQTRDLESGLYNLIVRYEDGIATEQITIQQ